jgi:hypothetical protein
MVVDAKTCLPSRSTQKLFYSYTGGETQKYARLSIYQINAPKFLLLSLKVLLQKRGMVYAKVIHEKRRNKEKKG